jgi:hypothetical protein
MGGGLAGRSFIVVRSVKIESNKGRKALTAPPKKLKQKNQRKLLKKRALRLS